MSYIKVSISLHSKQGNPEFVEEPALIVCRETCVHILHTYKYVHDKKWSPHIWDIFVYPSLRYTPRGARWYFNELNDWFTNFWFVFRQSVALWTPSSKPMNPTCLSPPLETAMLTLM